MAKLSQRCRFLSYLAFHHGAPYVGQPCRQRLWDQDTGRTSWAGASCRPSETREACRRFALKNEADNYFGLKVQPFGSHQREVTIFLKTRHWEESNWINLTPITPGTQHWNIIASKLCCTHNQRIIKPMMPRKGTNVTNLWDNQYTSVTLFMWLQTLNPTIYA